MMKNLIMITNHFPYGNDTGEMYLRQELGFLSNQFENVFIFACDAFQQEKIYTNKLPKNVKAYPLDTKRNYKRVQFVPRTVRRYFFNHEREVIEERKRISWKQKILLSYFMAKIDIRYQKIKQILQKDKITEAISIYSYRFFDTAYLTVKLKHHYFAGSKTVTRAHGYDLYEERNTFRYLPLREYMLDNLDYALPCSLDGEKYLKNRYPQYKSKIRCQYLGSADYGVGNRPKGDKLEIISCSNVIPIKRVDRIAEVVKLIDNVTKVHWTHLGAGTDYEKIRRKYQSMINDKIVTFMGNTDHNEVISIYKRNSYDLFINLSISEGIPQAIMEAMSFGIPIVATDTGGNSEIVKNMQNGYLVSVEENEKAVADLIIDKFSLKQDVKKLRESSREIWSENFSVSRNVGKFIELLTS